MACAWLLACGCASAVAGGGADGAVGTRSSGPTAVAEPGAVGASCAEAQPRADGPALPTCAGAGCYLANEVYYTDHAPSCGGLAGCLVYHWDQHGAPEEQALREFCSCRCDDGAGHPDPGCACPSGFACTLVFAAGDQATRGSYCVRRELTGP
jgi:hypothetical protein